MKPIDPRIDPSLVPPGSRAIIVAEHQDEWLDLPSVRTPAVYDGKILMINPYVITRWSLSDEERAAVVRGEDVFITIVSGGVINPLSNSKASPRGDFGSCSNTRRTTQSCGGGLNP